MSGNTTQTNDELHDELADKVELTTLSKANLGNKLLLHRRMVLQDMPANGVPEVLTDAHRQSITKLIEKHGRDNYTVRIKSIIGYASADSDTLDPIQLSTQRAEAVRTQIEAILNLAGIAVEEVFTPSFKIHTAGESALPHPTNAALDNALNRRVDVLFTLHIALPQPSGVATPTSRMWQIDFGPTASGWFLDSGIGTLSMLPDGDNGLTQAVSRSFTFEQLGFSYGLVGKLKKLKRLQRFPRLQKLLKVLDPDLPGNYQKTEAVLDEVGFSTDLINVGGGFETSLALSFEDMRAFNYASLSGSLSVLGNVEGVLLLLHSDYFFASTVIAGAGQNIALPDADLTAVPAGFVQLGAN